MHDNKQEGGWFHELAEFSLPAAVCLLALSCWFLSDAVSTLKRSFNSLEGRVVALELALKKAKDYSPSDPDPVPALAAHIARMEGYPVPGSLARRQFNPGCLAYAGQPGAARGSQGYARFPTAVDGFMALDRDLRAKLARGYPLGRAWPYLKPKGE